MSSLTSNRDLTRPLEERCTCTGTRVYPQKPQSPCADYWWFCSSLHSGLAPAVATETSRHSWSRTGPSDNTSPQGSPQPDGLSAWRPGNHLWNARVTINSNGRTCNLRSFVFGLMNSPGLREICILWGWIWVTSVVDPEALSLRSLFSVTCILLVGYSRAPLLHPASMRFFFRSHREEPGTSCPKSW